MTVTHDVKPLDDLLAQVNLRARIVFRGLACERWAIGGSQQGRLGFHVVLSGRSWLCLPDGKTPLEMTAGALLIYRPDRQHLLADTAFAKSEMSPTRVLGISNAVVGPHVGLPCGYFDGGIANIPVVKALPTYLVWPNFDAFPGPLGRLMRTLAACALDEARGRDHILQRLCETLMLMILREPAVLNIEHIGVLCAQRDPVLRRVFDAIHARPGRPWTLASMARRAGISRSAFAAKFKQRAEISAMQYLRRYRLALAERRMREEGVPVEQAVRAVGYRSVGAFRRAARAKGTTSPT